MSIAPVLDPNVVPDDATCQEASELSVNVYIPCSRPALYVVEHRERCYYMCEMCANHNILHRGGVMRAMRGPSGPVLT